MWYSVGLVGGGRGMGDCRTGITIYFMFGGVMMMIYILTLLFRLAAIALSQMHCLYVWQQSHCPKCIACRD